MQAIPEIKLRQLGPAQVRLITRHFPAVQLQKYGYDQVRVTCRI